MLARAAAHEGPTRPPQVALRTQEVVDVVSSDEKVLDFPKAEITSEEKARRAMAEAKRLASLAPGEWRLWIGRTAERLGMPRAALEGLISAIIKDSERKAREDKAEARRQLEGEAIEDDGLSLEVSDVELEAAASLSTVNRAHMAYDDGGIKALKPKLNGGRKHENMTLAEEKALLARFAKAAGAGEMLTP